ncbi:MAG: SDR family NAD(P)-dependent oxidoreductase [Acidobacteriota bacterium]
MPTHAVILGISPFSSPDPALVASLCRAGAAGVLDLGVDAKAAREALARLRNQFNGPFGVRIPTGLSLRADELPQEAKTVVLPAGAALEEWPGRDILVQVTTLAQAQAAVEAGATGLIAKGAESGGPIGSESSLILLQHLVASLECPIWVQGGIGVHTAAACMAAGATGVVLDSQLALFPESSLPEPIQEVVRKMEGSETRVIGGHRLYARPDLPIADEPTLTPEEISARLGASDLKETFLSAGQDAAFAAPFLARFKTVSGMVRGLRQAMAQSLRQARELKPLAPGSPLAAAHGIRVPIAQGPMTRVSDRAAFADAVSEAGGLPFLALALLRGAQVRELVKETAALLGDRTWGVGILGFVPPSVREEQLEALRETRPPVALIAGGRPSQARRLEAEGITTYLHVPSPGLLELFLKDGARRFVFEGREGGGHVGPRNSFVLWETQIQRLLAFEAPEELSLLFAGGIHDARSAAMVSAMAAPLAARGARIGVLMGTAYLFTREAVTTGAILPAFQETALQCERTVLLETGPGHATRCAETDYVTSFSREKERLLAKGLKPRETWVALEELNVGRLRIASKGLRREGHGKSGKLVSVVPDEQRRQGLYMIGDAASLRRSTTTMAALHREVSEGSTALLAELDCRLTEGNHSTRHHNDIAIIGMACVFPGARDKDEFWANIAGGNDAITEVPPERWDVATYYDPDSMNGEKTPSKWGGFIEEVPFDPLEYGIPPKSLASIEPVQLLSLEAAARALEDAGYGDKWFDRGRTSVIFGAEAGTELTSGYGFRALYPQYVGKLPEELGRHLPSLTEDSFPGVLANVIAGRIANRLDLGGVNYTVDAACASSLAALDMGIKELAAGTSDMVLCGGADLHNSINDYLLFSSVHALSRTGECRTFDANADGIVLGEGVAVIALKRLADAERDGDRIYAVIEGMGGSSDGKSLGLTAPRKDGQVLALTRAYEQAGKSPRQVGLVEAHGTGTVVGDRTELETLTEVFGQAGARPGSIALGSVKSQIGHAKCAAGMAGLIKAALSLYHGVLPPTLHIQQPNPSYQPETSPFVLSDYSRPWVSEKAEPFRAAVSAFGFGGANFHALLAEAPDHSPVAQQAWPAELFLFRGDSTQEVRSRIEAVSQWLQGGGKWRMRDLAHTIAWLGQGPVQVAVVATDRADLARKLERAAEFQADPDGVFVSGGVSGGVAFLFPGQGSQRPGMLADLFTAFPFLRRYLRLGRRWVDRLYPPTAYDPQICKAQKDALTDTRVAQPALGMVELATAELLSRFGVQAQMLAGHSYGELVALCRAGALSPEQLLDLSEARGECILRAAGDDPGTMAGVGSDIKTVEKVLEGIDGVVVANHNAPQQVVISGPHPAVERALQALKAAGLPARGIPVSCAFHSPLVGGAEALLAERLAKLEISPPGIPVWSNTRAAEYPNQPGEIRALLAQHVVKPVRFVDQVEAMYEAGARVFVEVGPGQVLSGLVDKILSGRPHRTVRCDDRTRPGLHQLMMGLGQLAVSGARVDMEALFAGREARLLDLADPKGPGRTASTWLVNGHRAQPLQGELPKEAMRPLRAPVGSPTALAAAPSSVGSSDTVVLEYLRGVRELVATQREVMLSYLGARPSSALPESIPSVGVEVVTDDRQAAVSATSPAEPASLKDALVAIVSDRTGYPPEMLDLDADLEAELSIDSIKRVEILGALGERMGLSEESEAEREEFIEELAGVKTLGGILDWFEGRQSNPASAQPGHPVPTEPSADDLPGGGEKPSSRLPEHVERYLLDVTDAPAVHFNGRKVAARRFAITDDGRGVAQALADRLGHHDAKVQILDLGERVKEVDGLIHLASLNAQYGEGSVEEFFSLTRNALLGGAQWVLGASGFGGAFGRKANGSTQWFSGGVAGLLKSVAREWPDVHVRVVDVNPNDASDQIAGHLFDELLDDEALVEVGYERESRRRLELVSAGLDGKLQELTLGPESVVLLTGGARGITATIAIALAERFGCRLELVGRSAPPSGKEDPELAAATDAVAVRRVLIGRSESPDPKRIETECARILAAAEIGRTLASIGEAGGQARYHSLDVRDSRAFGRLIDEIYARQDRLDGVIHGAGVIEDKLLRHKSRESFHRVFATKVSPAMTLAQRIHDDVGFVVFFSSVSGAFGNIGQTDYAAANDALDKAAFGLNQRLSGRVVSITWGPWAGTGMVSPELQRQYLKRGVGLIEPAQGARALVDELLYGRRSDANVVLMQTDPEYFLA